jgi:hypothetical protein
VVPPGPNRIITLGPAFGDLVVSHVLRLAHPAVGDEVVGAAKETAVADRWPQLDRLAIEDQLVVGGIERGYHFYAATAGAAVDAGGMAHRRIRHLARPARL